ncbi:MAG: ester cyclase [Pseudomonadota bacterium]
MGAAENVKLVQDMYDALNSQDLDAHDRYWHPDMIWHGPPGFGDIHGLDAFKRDVMIPFYTAFPDYHAKNDIEFADDTWVAATGFLTGTHRGRYLGLAATGKPMRMRFSDFWLVRDGKLAENWVMVDQIDVMKQLGVDLMAHIPQNAAA